MAQVLFAFVDRLKSLGLSQASSHSHIAPFTDTKTASQLQTLEAFRALSVTCKTKASLHSAGGLQYEKQTAGPVPMTGSMSQTMLTGRAYSKRGYLQVGEFLFGTVYRQISGLDGRRSQ